MIIEAKQDKPHTCVLVFGHHIGKATHANELGLICIPTTGHLNTAELITLYNIT